MTHTVVRLQGEKISSELAANELKTDIENELENRGYDTRDVAINDGTNTEGDVTLRVNIDFVKPSEANSFYSYLKRFVEANEVVDDEDEGFVEAHLDIHECMHLEGVDEPCSIGNSWRL